jgi:condensin complex subunit 1
MILGMLGKENKDIISTKLEVLRQVGLGEFSQDLLMTRLVCLSLQRMATVKKEKGSLAASYQRFAMNHPIFTRLKELVLAPCQNVTWFGFAEQMVNTVYLLSETPDVLCGQLLKNLTQQEDSSAFHLSKLCFMIGHISIKQIVHLETIESEWKRRKAEEGKSHQQPSDDLENVVATAEDEFSEAVQLIRERELLFGENSLLKAYGPLVVHICGNNSSFEVTQCPVLLARIPCYRPWRFFRFVNSCV